MYYNFPKPNSPLKNMSDIKVYYHEFRVRWMFSHGNEAELGIQ